MFLKNIYTSHSTPVALIGILNSIFTPLILVICLFTQFDNNANRLTTIGILIFVSGFIFFMLDWEDKILREKIMLIDTGENTYNLLVANYKRLLNERTKEFSADAQYANELKTLPIRMMLIKTSLMDHRSREYGIRDGLGVIEDAIDLLDDKKRNDQYVATLLQYLILGEDIDQPDAEWYRELHALLKDYGVQIPSSA